MRALALALLLARPAAACHDCGLTLARHLGVAADGTWAVTWQSSTGESDYSEIWGLTIGRGTKTVCTLMVGVDTQDHIAVEGKRPALCERAAGVTNGSTRPHRDRARFEQKIVAELQLTPVQPAPAPAVTMTREEDSTALRYMVKLGHRTLGEVVLDNFDEERFFSGTWAVSAYAHPRFDGLFLRVMTLMPMRENEWGSGSGCLSGRDVFVPVKP